MSQQALVDKLTAAFGIPERISFILEPSGHIRVNLNSPQVSATLLLQGAQLMSWRPANAQHGVLFCSSRAHTTPSLEIKGGIPICWPWFGVEMPKPDLGLHGFARLLPWQLTSCQVDQDGLFSLSLTLTIEEQQIPELPEFSAKLCLGLEIGTRLAFHMTTTNLAQVPWCLGQGFHTYFQVGAIDQVELEGLADCIYLDKAQDAPLPTARQTGVVRIVDEINRIYQHVTDVVRLRDRKFSRVIEIEPNNSKTFVVWNPGAMSAQRFNDLGPKDYQHFLCVETVHTNQERILLEPEMSTCIGVKYRLTQF